MGIEQISRAAGTAIKTGASFGTRMLGRGASVIGWGVGGYSSYKTFGTYSKNDPYNELVAPLDAELEKWRGAMWALLAAPYNKECVLVAEAYVGKTIDVVGSEDFDDRKRVILNRLNALEEVIDIEGEDARGRVAVVQNMMVFEHEYVHEVELLEKDRNKRFLKYGALAVASFVVGTVGNKIGKK